MSQVPKDEVIEAIEGGESTITRRIEIFEQDGETRWRPSEDEEVIRRLVTGGVTLDANRSERRMLDITLLNDDNLLRPDPRQGFWYDKVIKVYRGVHYSVPQRRPKITIVEGHGNLSEYKFLGTIKNLGYTRSDVDVVTSDQTALNGSEILISYSGTAATAKAALLQRHFDSGRSVMTISSANDTAQVPHLLTTAPSDGPIVWGVTPVSTDTPVAGRWTTGTAPDPATGRAVSALAEGALAVASWINGASPAMITASVMENNAGGRWFDLHLPAVEETHIIQLIAAALRWLQNYTPYADYEVQLGEFCIDGINDDRFPYQLKVTCRDYTKRCMNSKIARDVIFKAGTSISELIRACARNSGILGEMNVPEIGKYLLTDLAYAANTPRWEIMEKAANGVGYQLYFDNTGSLTLLPFNDPVYDPVSHEFKTGPQGNLVSFSRSTNDSNLFNHIAVTGGANAAGVPYFGEAMNTEPDSPTSIEEIGDRFYPYAFDTVMSDGEARDLAVKFLKVAALETYDFNFSSICYPWMEVNTIARILDPNALSFEPDKYLASTCEIPLDLGPMSMNAKRITHVGSRD